MGQGGAPSFRDAILELAPHSPNSTVPSNNPRFGFIMQRICLYLVAMLLFCHLQAARKWHFYKEQSVQRKTAIGCILLALVVGIPMHVVIWRHFSQE